MHETWMYFIYILDLDTQTVGRHMKSI